MQKPNAFNRKTTQALLSLMLLFSVSIAFAQAPIPITGNVKSNIGEAIIGATVLIKGTTNGISTDVNGKFSLTVPNANQAILQVTCLGYEPYEVSLSSRSHINVELIESVNAMAEVSVVAYGVQKKATLTGAIASVGTEDLLKSPNSSIANALTGKMTGVSTVQYSGQPGAEDPDIFIRGGGSLNPEESAPLMLVDGIERSFFQMDPHEIASITVLKDASATAVFGVRGANGVILVTTVRGTEGAATISINSSFGVQATTRTLEMADSYTYALTHNELMANDGNTPDQFAFNDYLLERFKLGDDPIMYPDVEWRDYMTNDIAISTKHNMNISGGTKKVRYFISIGYMFQDGLFKDFNQEDLGYKYNRYNYRTNLDIDITNSTLLKLGIGGIVGDKHEPYFSGDQSNGLWKNINWAQPFASPGIIDGIAMASQSIYGNVVLRDPVSSYYGRGFKSEMTNTMNMDLTLTQNLDAITKGLTVEVKGAYNTNYSFEKERQGSTERYTPYYQSQLENVNLPTDQQLSMDDPNYNKTIVHRIVGENGKLNYGEETRRARSWYAEASLRYNREFGDHSIGGLLLYSQDKKYYPSSFGYVPAAYVSFVGRVTYDYKTKYMAEFNIGYNGSENFAPDQRFGTFPAVSAGYIVTEESFMKNQKVVNYLKLRASVGLVGKDNVGSNRFLYLPNSYTANRQYGSGSKNWYQERYGYNFGLDNSNWLPGATEGTIGNPFVTWETALKQNYGIDATFLGDRLKASFDYFIEQRTDILIKRSTVPNLSGLNKDLLPVVNLGEVNNEGYEVDITWRDRIGTNFNYYVNANVSFAKNEIIYQDEIAHNEAYAYRTGHSVGSVFGYVADGFYSEGDFAADGSLNKGLAVPTSATTLHPGDVKYRDLNEDGIINNDDQTKIGYAIQPEYVFGLNLGADYKGFTFDMNWVGATNRSLLLSDEFRIAFNGEDRGLMQYHVDNRWTPETAETAKHPRLSKINDPHNYLQSTLWVEDGSYIKLKNIALGYAFTGRSGLKRVGISRLAITFTGYNLLTFDYFGMMDPESKPNQKGDSYPIVKTFSLGVNITF